MRACKQCTVIYDRTGDGSITGSRAQAAPEPLLTPAANT